MDFIKTRFPDENYGKPYPDDRACAFELAKAFSVVLYRVAARVTSERQSPLAASAVVDALESAAAAVGAEPSREHANLDLTGLRKYMISRIMASPHTAFRRICDQFSLDQFSIFCIMGALCAYAAPDSSRLFSAFGPAPNHVLPLTAAARLFFGESFSPLLYARELSQTTEALNALIRIPEDEHYSEIHIRLDRGLAGHLLGDWSCPAELLKHGEYFSHTQAQDPVVIQQALLEELLRCTGAASPFVQLCGRAQAGKRFLIRHTAALRGLDGLILDARSVFEDADAAHLLWMLEREAALNGWFLAFTEMDRLAPQTFSGALFHAIRRLRQSAAILFFSCESPGFLYADKSMPPQIVSIPVPTTLERLTLLRAFAGDTPYASDVNLAEYAGKYRLTAGQMKQAVESAARVSAENTPPAIGHAELSRCFNALVSADLGTKATLVRTGFALEDVILPDEQKRLLLFACSHLKNQHTVYDEWGFGKKLVYGRGISLLFYGPPGTGKTMAASAIANRLELELFRVDISKIVDKYIGETEKNIGEVFEKASQSGVVLFFDEADALFSKRSDVNSSNDRHANMESGFLLQCIEDYDGVSILATNHKRNIDPAFMRRIRFLVEFPHPDPEIRRKLWHASFPGQAPLDSGIDFDYLAQFDMAGGAIKNAASNAAFYAANAGGSIGMEAIVNSVYFELKKTSLSPDSNLFGTYGTLLQK